MRRFFRKILVRTFQFFYSIVAWIYFKWTGKLILNGWWPYDMEFDFPEIKERR